jgi:hypothetical protein
MATSTPGERARSIYRLFKDSNGKVGPRATLDCTSVIFKFDDDTVEEIELAQVFGDALPPPCVGRAAAAFGISTSAGNAGNTLPKAEGETRKDASEVREAVADRLQTFLDGQWSTDRGGGGAPSLFIEAVRRYRVEKGAPVDEAAMAKISEKLKSDPDLQKGFMKVPAFMVVLETVKAENASKRLEALKAKASQSEIDDSAITD